MITNSGIQSDESALDWQCKSLDWQYSGITSGYCAITSDSSEMH
jgi:hypothetical protein